MIDIFAKWKDGDLVCVPKKRRGMSKGEYLRAAHVCLRFNEASFPSLSSRELSLLSGIAPDLDPSSQLRLSGEKNTRELSPIETESPQDDVRQPMQLTLFYIPDQ